MGDEINPFEVQIGEILPMNVGRIFGVFLMRKDALTFKANSQKLLARIALLKDHILIAKFVGPKPSSQVMEILHKTLNQH